MLVEKQMELIKGGTAYLPMAFLIEVAHRDGVCENLIQHLNHLQTNGFVKADRQALDDCAKLLNFLCLLLPFRGNQIALLLRDFQRAAAHASLLVVVSWVSTVRCDTRLRGSVSTSLSLLA